VHTHKIYAYNVSCELPIPYLHDFVTKLCRQQATVIQNHENVNVGQGGAQQRKQKMLRLGGGQAYDPSRA
jgi:hypothetical protein